MEKVSLIKYWNQSATVAGLYIKKDNVKIYKGNLVPVKQGYGVDLSCLNLNDDTELVIGCDVKGSDPHEEKVQFAKNGKKMVVELKGTAFKTKMKINFND